LSEYEVEFVGRPHDGERRVERRLGHHAGTHPEGQQVFDRDRPDGGNGLVQRTVDPGQNTAVGHLRQQTVDRVLEVQDAVLDQKHGERGQYRLGERGDPEDRVPTHRC
jgi:hypothetical protein